MHYIENTNSIILAVVEANTDLANADVIKMVRELDPRGNGRCQIVFFSNFVNQ